MMKGLKETKATIRDFMREQYTDERLVMLLDHARAGHLLYDTCCCFAGIVSARHRLRRGRCGDWESHGVMFMDIPGGPEASAAFYALGYVGNGVRTTDEMRRKRLIPMVLIEIRRRTLSHETRRTEYSPASRNVGKW